MADEVKRVTYEGDFPEDMESKQDFLFDQYRNQEVDIDKNIKMAEQHIGNANVLSAGVLSGKKEKSPYEILAQQTQAPQQTVMPEMPTDVADMSEEMKRFISPPQQPTQQMPQQDSADRAKIEDFINKSVPSTSEQKQPSDIEDLIFLGRMTKEIDFHGVKIVMQTLSGFDNMQIIDEVAHLDIVTRFAATIIGTLVRSIKQINGYKLFAVNDSELSFSKFKNVIDAKGWIMGLQQPVLDELWEQFTKLLQEQQNAIGEVKN